MNVAISRRSLLTILAAGCALGVMPDAGEASSPDVTETLLSFVADRRSAATLGESWIDEDQTHASPSDVVTRLTATLHAQGWSGANDPAELRQRFNAAVRADYKSGETVTVEGWQLARTQADLCALAYFANAGLL
jgi:hypothetical protein